MPCADTRTPPRQAELDTPPKEGNCRYGLGNLRAQAVVHHPVKRSLTPLQRRGIAASEGGELPLRFGELGGASGCTPPRQAELDTPPEEGNCRYGLGNLRAQAVVNHPVRLRLTPLQRRGIVRLRRRGMVRHHTYTDTTQPPRQASPATPPEEGNTTPSSGA